MEAAQKGTKGITTNKGNDFVAIPYNELSYIQRAYVDYKAVNGLITDDDGIHKMTVDELATQLKCDRRTVYKNRDMVPNFWDLVSERRKQLAGKEQLAKMHEVWRLKAMGNGPSNFQYFQLWQANFNPEFRMPTEKIQIEAINSWGALTEKKRKEASIIEGEIVDATSTD